MKRYTHYYCDVIPDPESEYVKWTEVAELLEDLESRFIQTRCGCGHPACKRCQDDERTRAIIAKTKGESL